MFWKEDKRTEKFQIPDDIIDMSFAIKCKCLPLEHMHMLSQELYQKLPWLEAEKMAGIHPIYGAESGNGWERPSDPNDLLYFSRRQKMTLRLPKERISDAESLIGNTLNVSGYELEVGKSDIKKLSDLPTVFCRTIMTKEKLSEDDFLQWAYEELKQLDISVRKMMAGKERVFKMYDGTENNTRSLMIAELEQAESVRIQQHGLGEGRKLGYGLFMPQKDIKAVNSDD